MPNDPTPMGPTPDAGEPVPPWHGHPERRPEDWLQARQGLQAQWLAEVWEPFWHGASPAQQGEYLSRWQAPTPWREALSNPFPPLSEQALTDDLTESDAWRHAPAAPRPRAWWSRWRWWVKGR